MKETEPAEQIFGFEVTITDQPTDRNVRIAQLNFDGTEAASIQVHVTKLAKLIAVLEKVQE